jgi:CTP synthase
MVGKYINHKDAYLSVTEALYHAGIHHDVRVRIRSVEAEDIEEQGADAILSGACGIIVPGGFGSRGIEGKIAAARYAREKKIPYLGLCLGMQVAVVEFARHVCGIPGANSSEIDPGCTSPVIHLMEEQAHVEDKGGTMRLGVYLCDLVAGTRAAEAYGTGQVLERHRHRYEFNNDYRSRLEEKGMRIAGIYTKKNLVEIVELPDHPWFVGVQFHPEFRSRPVKPHPLFMGFIGAAVQLLDSIPGRE